MHAAIRAPKEFWLGVVYLTFGAVGLWFGLDYPLGTADRMGPGYLPCLVSALLIIFGVVSLMRATRLEGDEIGAIAFRPLLCVLGGVLAFAVLVERVGLVCSIFILVLMSAAGSRAFRFEWRAGLGLVAFVVLCCLVFVKALGVPLPLLGSWLSR
ncbi:tripartite tricarboxylate transporter TctB family protein [Ancylobacter sp. VNQ12]|uniref:tripartite tricarboxylate transporter TctB family protein n=1 Tax=Ancylobacter sp. VNQ12 TaxID=3400920 RepID=UPI003BFEC846